MAQPGTFGGLASPSSLNVDVTNALFESGMSPASDWRTANPMWQGAEDRPAPPASSAQVAPPAPQQQQQEQQANRERPEEAEFGSIVSSLMHGELSAADSVRAFANVARQRSLELRDAAAAQLQSDVRHAHLQEQASELELEASTWELLAHLYGSRDASYPGGLGGSALPAREADAKEGDKVGVGASASGEKGGEQEGGERK